jgi:hypothetical protein
MLSPMPLPPPVTIADLPLSEELSYSSIKLIFGVVFGAAILVFCFLAVF